LRRLAPGEVALLLAACARLVDPGFGGADLDQAKLGSLARRVSKALPWLGRGLIEDAVCVYASASALDVTEFVASSHITSARLAALLADDLPSSVELARRLAPEPLVQGQPPFGQRVADDLLRFWASEPAFAVRRRLGMLQGRG
jgi:hypothetical protein